jgi:hypothetical protein
MSCGYLGGKGWLAGWLEAAWVTLRLSVGVR